MANPFSALSAAVAALCACARILERHFRMAIHAGLPDRMSDRVRVSGWKVPSSTARTTVFARADSARLWPLRASSVCLVSVAARSRASAASGVGAGPFGRGIAANDLALAEAADAVALRRPVRAPAVSRLGWAAKRATAVFGGIAPVRSAPSPVRAGRGRLSMAGPTETPVVALLRRSIRPATADLGLAFGGGVSAGAVSAGAACLGTAR